MTLPIPSARRFYLLARFRALSYDERALASTLLYLRNAEPGTPIDASTPAYAKLVAAGYIAREDFAGATEDELLTNVAGLTRREATAVIAAVGT